MDFPEPRLKLFPEEGQFSSEEEAQSAWETNKNFYILSSCSEWNGKLINKKILLREYTFIGVAIQWFSIKKLPSVAFDHKKILDYSLKRLKWKFEYTTVAFSLLPKKFTISEIQNIYEIVFNRQFDKRNFAKKVLSLDILKEEEIKKDVSHRPPMLYSLKKDIGEVVEIL